MHGTGALRECMHGTGALRECMHGTGVLRELRECMHHHPVHCIIIMHA